MSRLSELVVRVLDPASLASWYCRVMGMEAAEDPRSPGGWRLRYPGPGASLVLTRAEAGAAPYTPSRDSCYWKVRDGARPRCTVYSTVQYSTVQWPPLPRSILGWSRCLRSTPPRTILVTPWGHWPSCCLAVAVSAVKTDNIYPARPDSRPDSRQGQWWPGSHAAMLLLTASSL